MPSGLEEWFKSNYWILYIGLLGALAGQLYDKFRRNRLSEEKRAEKDRRQAQAKAESKQLWKKLWDELFAILSVAAICAAGLWVIGLSGIGESRAFMACTLTLLWLIFGRLDAIFNALLPKRPQLGGWRVPVGISAQSTSTGKL